MTSSSNNHNCLWSSKCPQQMAHHVIMAQCECICQKKAIVFGMCLFEHIHSPPNFKRKRKRESWKSYLHLKLIVKSRWYAFKTSIPLFMEFLRNSRRKSNIHIYNFRHKVLDLVYNILYDKRVHSWSGYYFWDKGTKEYVALDLDVLL